jgi:hypothetical protein
MQAPSLLDMASSLQEQLLALPDPLFMEMIDQWVWLVLEQEMKTKDVSQYLRLLKYQIRSNETEETYDSFLLFDDIEPETEEFEFLPPEPQIVRDVLGALSTENIYQRMLCPIIDGLQQSWHSKHPFSEGSAQVNQKQARGVLLQYLLQCVTLRQSAVHLSKEAFEATYQEQLNIPKLPLRAAEKELWYEIDSEVRLWQFRIQFINQSDEHISTVQEALQKLGASISDTAIEGTLTGDIPYIYWHGDDIQALRRARKWLNRWQQQGWLTWTSHKAIPPRQKKRKRR